jgi:hypothetical protein
MNDRTIIIADNNEIVFSVLATIKPLAKVATRVGRIINDLP